MTKNVWVALVAIMALSLGLSSCKGDKKGGGKSPSSIELSVTPAEFSIAVGKTQQLEVRVKPADTKISFESSDAAIATVDAKGVVTGVKVGNAVIKVKAGDRVKEAKVTVTEASKVDNSRFVGNESTFIDGLNDDQKAAFIPFYLVDFAKMFEEKDNVIEANKSQGWEEFPLTGENEKLSKDLYVVTLPKALAGKKLLNMVQYLHFNQKGGDPVIALNMALAYDVDPFEALAKDENEMTQEEKQTINMLLTFLMSYGFNESPTAAKFSEGQLLLVSYRKMPEGYYQALMYAELNKRDNKYWVDMEIQKSDGPKTQSATMMTKKAFTTLPVVSSAFRSLRAL